MVLFHFWPRMCVNNWKANKQKKSLIVSLNMSHSALVVYPSSLILIKLMFSFLAPYRLWVNLLLEHFWFCFVFVLDFEFCQMTKRDQMCHEGQILIFMSCVLGVFCLPLFYFQWMFPLQHILYESCPKQIIKKSVGWRSLLCDFSQSLRVEVMQT